jgi:hypothetical protein
MGDLNIDIGFPCDKWEEVIVNLLDELCLVDLSRGYHLWTPRRTATKARWTWIQKRGTMQHYLQPDYILARTGETSMFTGMGFCFPWFLHSDHRTIVAVVRRGGGLAGEVPGQAPETPAVLAAGNKGRGHNFFDALAAKCVDPKLTRKLGKDWMSKATWRLIAKWASLLQTAKQPH